MRPDVQVSERQQKSVTVSISDPIILQNKAHYDCVDLNLDSIKYTITEVQQDGVDGQSTNGNFGCNTSASPITWKYRNLKPGREYKLKLRVDYNTGDHIETEEKTFQTRPYTGTLCVENVYAYNSSSLLFLQRDRICAFSVGFLLCMLLR